MALRRFVWKIFDVNLTWIVSVHPQKAVYMDPIVKFPILRSYLLRKKFFIFSSKKLEVVTIARYLNAFWFFDFSLLDILPKYMNPKLMSRSLYVTDDLPEKTGHQTNGHHFLDVRHTKALRANILKTPNTSKRYLSTKVNVI